LNISSDHKKLSTPVRLNLGCGDKILPGYININATSSRKDKAPDIVADIRDLKISRPKSPMKFFLFTFRTYLLLGNPCLTSRMEKVAKNRWKIIIECPNSLYACQMIVQNPKQASRADQNGQMSMWPLYGDPSWRDPLMCHKWAYTPESLKAVLQEAGFVQVRQERAQYKLREPRDMRITGLKQK